MTLRQKCAWGQLVIFGATLIGWLVLFTTNGTIFYWQNDSMMMTFYAISGTAFVLLVLMNILVTLRRNHTEVTMDERGPSHLPQGILMGHRNVLHNSCRTAAGRLDHLYESRQ